jgi:hypothetical protein
MILACGIAVGGYAAFAPPTQTWPGSAMGNTGTDASAPAAARALRGEIILKPQLADRAAQPHTSVSEEPDSRSATSIAGSHSAGAAPGDETHRAPVAPAISLETNAPVPPAAIKNQGASMSNGSPGVMTSPGSEGTVRDQADNSARAQCPTASQALGLCDAQTSPGNR